MSNSLKNLTKGDSFTVGSGLSVIHYSVLDNDPKTQRIKVHHKLFPSRKSWYKYSYFI